MYYLFYIYIIESLSLNVESKTNKKIKNKKQNKQNCKNNNNNNSQKKVRFLFKVEYGGRGIGEMG